MGHVNGDTTEFLRAGALAVLQNCFDACAQCLRIGGCAACLTCGPENLLSFGSNVFAREFVTDRDGTVGAVESAFTGNRFGRVSKERYFVSDTERIIDSRDSVAAGV